MFYIEYCGVWFFCYSKQDLQIVSRFSHVELVTASIMVLP